MMLDMESVESTEEAEGEETFLRTASRRTSCTAEATMIGRAIAIDQKLEGGLKQSGALAGI